jgi:hypothetical protein
MFLVKIGNTRDELGEELLGVLFAQIAAGQNVVEQFST